ncbi:hypothetical protein JW710_05080 [Candidatus Dojkabacteria bacterium]|nr:hypothetical protein [Candidatus Dojkabacteria bacterium]
MRKIKLSRNAIIVLSLVGFLFVGVTAYIVSSSDFSFEYRRRAGEEDMGIVREALVNGEVIEVDVGTNPPSKFFGTSDVDYTDVKFMLYRDGERPPEVGECLTDGESGHYPDEADDDWVGCCEGLEYLPFEEPNGDICKSDPTMFTCTSTVCGDGKCESPENKCNCPDDCITDCLQAGESYNPSLGPNDPNFGKSCCEGLIPVSPEAVYDEECNMLPIAGAPVTCSNCGNDTCETWENKCSCSKDCGEVEICDNGKDDDTDGYVDCKDPDCDGIVTSGGVCCGGSACSGSCVSGSCCETKVCGNTCCGNADDVCVNNQCCAVGKTCGLECCGANQGCTGVGCLNFCETEADCTSNTTCYGTSSGLGYCVPKFCDEPNDCYTGNCVDGQCDNSGKPLPPLPSQAPAGTSTTAKSGSLVLGANAQSESADNSVSTVVKNLENDSAHASFNLFEIYGFSIKCEGDADEGSPVCEYVMDEDMFNQEAVNHEFAVWACGCVQNDANDPNECECVTDYVKTDDYFVYKPSISSRIDDSTFCYSLTQTDDGTGWVYPGPLPGSNRSWIKYVATDSLENEQVAYYMASISLSDPGFLGFNFKPGERYQIDGYVCHGRDENWPDDAEGPYKWCEQTPIDTIFHTALTEENCDQPTVDLEADVTMLSENSVPVGDMVKVSASRIKNYTLDHVPSLLEINLSKNLDCASCDAIKSYSYTHDTNPDAIPIISATYTFEYTDLEAGVYIMEARVFALEDLDSNLSNNVDSVVFEVYDEGECEGVTCGEKQILNTDTCECEDVDCTSDDHCSLNQMCDLESHRCVCDDSLCDQSNCPERNPECKEMNSDCSACICKNSCLMDQVQDASSCECYDVCKITPSECIREGKVLNLLTCECEAVECIDNDDCQGMEYCQKPEYECECPSCGPRMKAVNNCSECVCDTTCAPGQIVRSDCTCYTPPQPTGCTNECSEGQIQLSDCTCYTPSSTYGTGGPVSDEDENEYEDMREDVLDDSGVKLVIETPSEDETYYAGKKILLRYKLEGDGDVDTDQVVWYVNGEKVGTGNFVAYTFEEADEYKIEVKYKGESQDKAEIKVLEDEAKSETAEEREESKEGIGIVWYFLIGAGILIVVGIVIAMLSKAGR